MKVSFPEGTRVELISMGNDPDPIPAGSKGTVIWVDDMNTVHVRWDNGRSLGLVPGTDRWRKIHDAEPSEEIRTEGDSQDESGLYRGPRGGGGSPTSDG